MSKRTKDASKTNSSSPKVAARTSTTGAKKTAVNRRGRVVTPPSSKLARLVALLRRPGGATLQVLIDETGWQAHSVRGAISGTIKKKLALVIESKRVEGERVYRVVGG